MFGFAFASGVSQLCVMGEPEEIGVDEGGGGEGDAVNGEAGENERAVGCVHGFPFSQYCAACCPHPGPLPQG